MAKHQNGSSKEEGSDGNLKRKKYDKELRKLQVWVKYNVRSSDCAT